MLAVVGLIGVLLVLLEPPVPIQGGAACPPLPFALCPRLWDQRHVPMHDADDVAIWGSGLGRREHWPRWLLVAAAGLGLLGLSGAGPGLKSSSARLLLGAAAGALVGEYLALELVPAQFILQVSCSNLLQPSTFSLCMYVVKSLQQPWLPWLRIALLTRWYAL